MKTVFVGLAVGLSIASSAFAYQEFSEYRIMGSEIRSVTLGEQQHEDPATLVIELNAAENSPQKLVIESDGFLDECLQEIQNIIGDNTSYVQIVVSETADTMNGTLHTECAILRWSQM